MTEQVHDWRPAASVSAGMERVPKPILRIRVCFVLVLLDLFGMTMAFMMAGLLRLHRTFPGEAALQLAILAPMFVLVGLLSRAYSPWLIHDCWVSIGRALRAILIAFAATVLIFFFARIGGSWSRATLLCSVGLCAVCLGILRCAFGRHVAVLIGGEPYEVLRIHDTPGGGGPEFSIAGISTLPGEILDPLAFSPAAYDRFAKQIEFADRVVVHCPIERRHYWVQALKGADVQGELALPELTELNPLGANLHEGTPTLVVTRGPLGLKDRTLKRGFDLLFGSLILLAVAPLMAVVALLIKLQDGGPVLFSQVRVGRSGRQFHIFKFRSMRVASTDANGDRSASRDDDRITRLGRVIRAASIDELPQLFNVLKGEMSVVGPRPHALGSTADNQLFWHIDERYWHRHAMRPGLTGLAQVRGYRGATHCREDLVNRLQSDLEYMRNWTIWRDVMILMRTLAVVFHKNAY